MSDEKQALINIDDVDYYDEDLTDDQKYMVNHIQGLQQSINQARFSLDRDQVAQKGFVEMLKQSLAEPKTE